MNVPPLLTVLLALIALLWIVVFGPQMARFLLGQRKIKKPFSPLHMIVDRISRRRAGKLGYSCPKCRGRLDKISAALFNCSGCGDDYKIAAPSAAAILVPALHLRGT